MGIHVDKLVSGELDRIGQNRLAVHHSEYACLIKSHLRRYVYRFFDGEITSVTDIFGLAGNTGNRESGNDHIHPAIGLKCIYDILHKIRLVDLRVLLIAVRQILQHTFGNIIADGHIFVHDQNIRDIAGNKIRVHFGHTGRAVIIVFRQVILAVILDIDPVVGALLVKGNDLIADIIGDIIAGKRELFFVFYILRLDGLQNIGVKNHFRAIRLDGHSSVVKFQNTGDTLESQIGIDKIDNRSQRIGSEFCAENAILGCQVYIILLSCKNTGSGHGDRHGDAVGELAVGSIKTEDLCGSSGIVHHNDRAVMQDTDNTCHLLLRNRAFAFHKRTVLGRIQVNAFGRGNQNSFIRRDDGINVKIHVVFGLFYILDPFLFAVCGDTADLVGTGSVLTEPFRNLVPGFQIVLEGIVQGLRVLCGA